MRKILFLDIDGVLNTEQQQWKCQMEGSPPADKFGYTFDPKAISYLGEILNITGAEIVLFPEQQVHFVKCNPQFGINRKVMEAVMRVFG